MKVLQEQCPVLFDMLQTIDDFPSFLKTTLKEVICKVKTTFEDHKGYDTGPSVGPASRDAFHPALPEVCRRGKYQLDGKKGEVPFCSKKHGKHPTLLPGIFTVFCQHVAPEAVICDNACNLHA
ncbi:hypothetical protein CHS0354_018964 [Potamilus streckersoni]|uniref:Uncharacterized protein n=1 Tax=Potamilus streckersoni TaxID=2493646 RepID=A0AAE0W884_9BIVA|nr:hypothetical protein CHS0354_018964 [Potamilus streckersoni]